VKMLTLHHLNNSRSQKILWLLEELELDYRLVCHKRDPKTLMGPPELKQLHALGKAPVLDDADIRLGESGAITQYLLDRYASGRLAVPQTSPLYANFVEWLYVAVSGGMNPIMIKVYCRAFGLEGSQMDEAASAELGTVLTYLEDQLDNGPFLAGNLFSAADIQMSFIPELAGSIGCKGDFPGIAAWLDRLYARPGFQRSISKGGEYAFANQN